MLKVSEFADMVGCSRDKAYQMVNAGQVPSVLVGGMRRIPLRVVEEMIASGSTGIS
jgi:excisionase family DNA binding protein